MPAVAAPPVAANNPLAWLLPEDQFRLQQELELHDPQKKQPVESGNNPFTDARQMGSQEIGTAIDRLASAANSVVDVAGRIGTNMVSRLGSSPRRKLRDVLLPDGYPILITGATDAAASANQ